MFDLNTLANIVVVGFFVGVFFVALPAAVWLLIKYIEFLSWAGGL